MRVAGRVLRLVTTYGAERLEAACARADAFGEGDYLGMKRILEANLDREPLPHAIPARGEPKVYAFARPADKLAASLVGGMR